MRNCPRCLFKNRFSLVPLVISLILLAMCAGCIQGTTETSSLNNTNADTHIFFNDSLGNRVELSQPATRIVAGNSAVAEMLVTIGAGDRIVGITDSVKSRKEILEKIPPGVMSIGTADTPDLETIILLKPDVLLLYGASSGHQAQNLEKILAQNISIVTLDCYKLDGVSNDAYALGIMTGNPEGAHRYIQFNRKYRQLVESRLSNLSPDEIRVVYAESESDYIILNRATGIGQILDTLHARNAYGNSTTYEFPRLNPEWVIKNNPDIILRKDELVSGIPLNATYDRIISRTGYDQVYAVRNERVYVYNNEIVGRPSVVIGLVYIAKALYPDRFADINPGDILNEYSREFGFYTNKKEWIYPPFDDPVNRSSPRGFPLE